MNLGLRYFESKGDSQIGVELNFRRVHLGKANPEVIGFFGAYGVVGDNWVIKLDVQNYLVLNAEMLARGEEQQVFLLEL